MASNQSLGHYNCWRPLHHPLPAKGWINDPCAVGYNPMTKTYHLGFQWNPDDCEWGNISWGSACSTDLLRWEFMAQPTLRPCTSGSLQGVFTGCMVPHDRDGKQNGSITAFYTAVYHLPIHWTRQYVRGAEKLHMAVSQDSGRSWKALGELNPVLDGPPGFLEVTGWRDPFVAPWPHASQRMGCANACLWGVVSGGIRGVTPTVFLYRVNPTNLHEWEYVGPLVELGLNFTLSRWSHDFGTNWEVVNFISLSEESEASSYDFLILSAEGRRPQPGSTRSPNRDERAQMFLCGDLDKTDDGSLRMQFKYGGVLDYGAFYAGNSFWDPVANAHILWGWVQEDDLPLEMRRCQGWAGALSFPRVIRLVTLDSVESALVSSIPSITSIGHRADERHPTLYTIQYLAALPDPRIEALRQEMVESPLTTRPEEDGTRILIQSGTAWNLEASFDIDLSVKNVGLLIVHPKGMYLPQIKSLNYHPKPLLIVSRSVNHQEQTKIYFTPKTETLHVDRSHSTSIPGLCLANEAAPHTLFRRRCKDEENDVVGLEPLTLSMFFDGSILEIFANDRTAITTRIYPSDNSLSEIRPWIDVVQPSTSSIQGRNVVIYLPPGPLFDCSGNGFHVPKIPRILASTTHATIVTINYRLGRAFHDSHQSLPETIPSDDPFGDQAYYQYPIPVHDTLAGFDWVTQNFQPTRLGVIGAHIGGSLALMLALTEAASVKAVAALDPVCDWPGLDAFCTQAAQHNSKTTSARKRPSKATRHAPNDLVPLLEARERLFSTPERYFDPFASPVLFLRSAGKDVPPTFPKYFTGPEYPVPILKPPSQFEEQTDFWDVYMPPDEGNDTSTEYPTNDSSERDDDANEHPIRRRKALRRWPPYGLDYGTGGASGLHYQLGVKRLQVTLPWVRIFSRTDPENTDSPQNVRSRKSKAANTSTVLAGQASEMVDVMQRACFWGHEKGVGERRVTLASVPSSGSDEMQAGSAGEWIRETLSAD
ncbi:glycosyl hydrolase [Aspergillus floccosus]